MRDDRCRGGERDLVVDIDARQQGGIGEGWVADGVHGSEMELVVCSDVGVDPTTTLVANSADEESALVREVILCVL
jgi:hypothetical protein